MSTPMCILRRYIYTCMGKALTRPVAANLRSCSTMPITHRKCRAGLYPRSNDVQRFPVPDDKVHWQTPYQDYQPVDYTAVEVTNRPVWADLDARVDTKFSALWNHLDGKVDRRSHTGEYGIIDNIPRNPVGRTGICSRGLLGRWGPNHAADPIVTRWKRNAGGAISSHAESKKPILQFIAIQRSDTGEWAFPGGMVDPGETITQTLKREFAEEALNSQSSGTAKCRNETMEDFFHKGDEVYKGYVDDPRNTDNAWMETVAINFHDDTGQNVGLFKLHAGDDAVGVRWMDIDSSLKLFANHRMFAEKVSHKHGAHW